MGIIKETDFCDYIDQHNPLALRDNKCRLLSFDGHTECYKKFLKQLYEKYPKGFIDPVLILVELYEFTTAEAESIVVSYEYSRLSILLVDWKDSGSIFIVLGRVIRMLHGVVGSLYKEGEFKNAINLFLN